jgi:hypothetical protein
VPYTTLELIAGSLENLFAIMSSVNGMGLFEENPWLLVPIIILTGEIWSVCKTLAKLVLRRAARRPAQVD